MSKHTNFRRHNMGGHDAEGLKNFWEKVIQEQTKQREGEEFRLSKSALNKYSDPCAQGGSYYHHIKDEEIKIWAGFVSQHSQMQTVLLAGSDSATNGLCGWKAEQGKSRRTRKRRKNR